MNREAEEHQHLDAFGIVRESFRILRSCFKLLGFLTLTLLLPLWFVPLARDLLIKPRFHQIATDSFFLHKHRIYVAEILLIELSYVAFMLTFSLLYTSAVVYTVACLYTGRELSYATVISAVPRVWRRVMRTFLWLFAIVFVCYVAVVAVIFLWIWINGVSKLRSGCFLFGVAVIVMALLCGQVYVSMVGEVASVVSVVEDKYGLVAMKKSNQLLKGKRGTALELIIIYLVIVGIISGLFDSRIVHAGRRNVGVWERTAKWALLVTLQCAVNLMWLLSQSVLYFVCKSCHHERIDKSALSDHLEGYHGKYMPLKNGIGAIQLEYLDP